MTRAVFGRLPDGRAVTAHTLTAPNGLTVRVLDLGATVQGLRLPGGPGADVVLGHADPVGYTGPAKNFTGAVVGRYANRIAGARFRLDGSTVRLAANEGDTCLHGGPEGFDRRTWTVLDAGPATVALELVSPDGDQGFPGTVTLRAVYRVTDDGLRLDLEARTDAPTVVGPASHVYLNLAGEGAGTVDDHWLTVDAEHYLPVDGHGLPQGGLEPVAGTPFDLRAPARLGDRVRAPDPQVGAAGGIDHSFHLRGTGLRRAARLEHRASGRAVELHTDRPALQVYTGNALDGRTVGAGGRRYRAGDGIALEPQLHPDSPNRPGLSDPFLRPGRTQRSRTEWRFEF